MSAAEHATAGPANSTEYITHHLTHLKVGEGFWSFHVDTIFMSVLLGIVGYSVQIYCDFSGYTDIAIGAARVMGYELMENFDRAYLATSASEFWRRWHISLMSWFRDYLLRPLGWSRPGRPKWVRNILVVFLVSGLWHGAAWTFAAWGLLNAVYVIVGDSTRRRRDRLWERAAAALSRTRAYGGTLLLGARTWMARILIFNLMALGLVFFRAPSMDRALEMYGTLLGSPGTLLAFPALPRWELAVADRKSVV